MIRKSSDYRAEHRPCGGSADDFEVRHRFTKEEAFGKARLFAEICFGPGQEIPMHAHNNEFEMFFVIEGSLVGIDRDGNETPFEQGDYMLTGYGDSHSVRNDSGKPAKIMAIIFDA